MTRLSALLASSLVFATSGSAAEQQSSGTNQTILLQRAIERGKTMYLYDRAAWVTSDDLIAHLPAERQQEIGGWVVTPSTKGIHVDYFGKGTAADHVVYGADVNQGVVSNANVYAATARPMLKEPALKMARALHAAWTEIEHHPDWKPCANVRFNTIVLPPTSDGTVPVYFLTPQTETGSFPFGGHYEIDIAADGRTASSRSFTRSCITMTKPPPNSGGTLAMMFLTHSLDSQPTEIHVFEQYYVGVPVVVGILAPRSFWKVEGGTIEDVSDQIKQ